MSRQNIISYYVLYLVFYYDLFVSNVFEEIHVVLKEILYLSEIHAKGIICFPLHHLLLFF